MKLPSSLERIGEKTFYECSGLKSIDIPSNVSLIESDAFEFCYDLTTVIIRSSNITIECDAFRIDLNDIVLKVDNLDGFSIDEDAFFCINFTDCTLHIPAFLYDDCIEHPFWGKFEQIECDADDFDCAEDVEKLYESDDNFDDEEDFEEDYEDLDEDEDFDEDDDDDDDLIEKWSDCDRDEFEHFVDFFNDDFDDGTIFKVVYTNRFHETHGFRITHVRESESLGSQFMDAYCIDQDGVPEGFERTFRIYRFCSIEKEKKKRYR